MSHKGSKHIGKRREAHPEAPRLQQPLHLVRLLNRHVTATDRDIPLRSRIVSDRDDFGGR
jgi:hypothetical protein